MSPAKINFELTGACNLSCAHCLRDRTLKNELPLPLIQKALKQARAYGINRVSFTGGEPLLYSRFQELAESTVSSGVQFALVTNGILLPRFTRLLSRPELKPGLDRICVSLEGPDPETNDPVRGKGSFKKALQGILSARSRELPFAIKFTINSRNYQKIEEMALLAGKLGAFELQLAQLYPTPQNLSAGLALPPGQWELVQAESLRLRDLLKLNLIFSAGCYVDENFPICGHLGMTEYYVDSRGWLCLCCMLAGVAGRDSGKREKDRIADLRQTSFFDAHRKLMDRIIWFHKKRLERIERGEVSELEHYQCLSCGFHFGKLDWLKDFPGTAWEDLFQKARGGRR